MDESVVVASIMPPKPRQRGYNHMNKERIKSQPIVFNKRNTTRKESLHNEPNIL